MSTQRVLTGITTSGTPHLGNYVGAVRPSVQASTRPGVQSFYFLADYHALIKTGDPARVQRSTLEIAATWLAAGLDPERVVFYRQSDVPEIPELTWFLTCVTGKGVLNRAHAYKASVDKNTAAGTEPDDGVTAGLFMYPVLMGADILMFNAHQVPVGRDQIQHIEMARDMAASFNHLYGEHFTLPEAAIDDNVATLPGLDGRKMSKSYGNTIPLFVPSAELKKLIFSIVTDSRAPGEAKDTEGSPLFQLYQAFATQDETAAFAQAYADGIGWGDAKQQVFDLVEREIAPMRERYLALVARPGDIEDTLRDGARRLREEYATPLLARLREAVGLRDLSNVQLGAMEAESTVDKPPLATFKQYREGDGKFYFKLVEGDRVLLQSQAFDAPRDAGQAIAALKRGTLAIADAPAVLGEGVDIARAQAALDALAAADAEKAAKAGTA